MAYNPTNPNGQATSANSSPVVIASDQSAVPVSGSITIGSNSSVNLSQVAGTTTDVNSGTKSAGTQRVVIATDQPQLTNALKVDGSAVTQPVSGTVTANIGTSGSLALDASVTGLQVSQASTTSGQKGALALGAVTTSAPTYTTAQSNPLSLTTAGALRVDASATTQPVSGSLTQSGTWTVQPGNTANTTPWLAKINDGTNSITVKAASTASVAGDTSLAVALSPNSPVPTGTNAIGSVNLAPTASGGWSVYSLTNLTTTTTVSSAAGKFAGYMFMNLNSTPAYVQVFDTTSAVTLGGTTPTFVIPIPANGTAANGVGANLEMTVGIGISLGIKVAATTGATTATTVTTGLIGFVLYK